MRLTDRKKRSQEGFSLIELLVALVVIGVISAIAIPNMMEAIKKTRHTAAYVSIKELEGGLQAYILDKDGPPDTMNLTTLDPLVSGRYITAKQRRAIFNTLDRNRITWYYGYSGGGWWDYDYIVEFRPKKDQGDVWCYLYPEGIWRWEDNTWNQVM